MMRGRLLFVLWSSILLAAARSITAQSVGEKRCVSDYIKNITCAWSISDGPAVVSNSYNLNFIHLSSSFSATNVSCPLKATDQGFLCSCNVSNEGLGYSDTYRINLCNESTCQVLEDEFWPVYNIKLTPPPDFELQQSTDSINITCKSERYQTSMYMQDLDYELLLQESNSTWNRTFQLKSPKNMETIHTKSELKTNTEYCIKARFKPPKMYRDSLWSEWSKSRCWINKQREREEQGDIVLFLLKYLSPVCVTVGIILFLLYNPITRMKIKTLGHTPTPAPFFKPLFQKHEGNLQEWLSPHGKHALTYKTEEDFIADVVTIVPKSSPKDLEESHVVLHAPAAQLAFPLSATSYVCLPGTDMASPPLPLVHPGDTPYTQLPSIIWGFSFQEAEVISSSPKEFLETSHSDSGCTCEELTQSLECSLPCSPVDEIPSPVSRSDYCILNKTAEGLVPVLLSRQRD